MSDASVSTPVSALAAPETRDLSAGDFDVIARIAYAHAGIVLHPGKRVLVSSRLAKLMRVHSCDDMHAFVSLVANDARVRRSAIEALTTNHTKFFRENHHFQHVTQTFRPIMMDAVRARRRVRLWSAGSSTGEEVYSLTMTLLGSAPAESRAILAGDVALLATDINAQVITVGNRAQYAADGLAEIPPALASAWTERDADGFRVREEARSLVRFRQLNLLDEWPISGTFDAIFCRNTMIYFDAATTERLQCRLAEKLCPGGFLYLGHSERLLGSAADLFTPVGQTIYRKVAR